MKTMKPFEVYQAYIGIKTHFTNKTFDYSKYHGKSTANYSTFEKRNDRYFFEKLSKKYQDKEIIELLISNMLKKDYWIKDLLGEECENNRIEWKKRTESLTYLFKNDCRIIVDYMDKHKIEFDDLFKIQKSKYPVIVDLLLKNEIIPETYVILDKILNFSTEYKNYYKNDIIWENLMLKYDKYKTFVDLSDKTKKICKMALLQQIQEYKENKTPQ